MENMVVHEMVKRLQEVVADLEACGTRLAEVQAEYDNIAKKVENYKGVLLARIHRWTRMDGVRTLEGG